MAQQSKQAPGELEHVRAFVNTLEPIRDADELTSARALVAWLSDRGLVSPRARADRSDLERAIEFREAIRASLLANNAGGPIPAEACATIDQVLDWARLRPHLRADGTSVLEPDARGVDGALGRLLAIIHQSVAAGTWQRLKACQQENCQWAFYDHTKNRSRLWCSMSLCGNRAKARAFRERASGSGSSRSTREIAHA